MKILKELLSLRESSEVKWVTPSGADAHADYVEYKKKEDKKWQERAETIGARFPLFDTEDDFKDALKNGRIFTLSEKDWRNIQNLSNVSSIESLKDLVGGYVRPRDVDRIVDGINKGVALPLPIVLKGSKGRWIMSGNTRLNTAKVMKVPQQAIELDVSFKEI